MKIIENTSNKIVTESGSGTRCFYSYTTLVGIIKNGVAYRTDKFYSRTTSKHLGAFGLKHATPVDQAVLEGMV
jgi:hypothetical protein